MKKLLTSLIAVFICAVSFSQTFTAKKAYAYSSRDQVIADTIKTNTQIVFVGKDSTCTFTNLSRTGVKEVISGLIKTSTEIEAEGFKTIGMVGKCQHGAKFSVSFTKNLKTGKMVLIGMGNIETLIVFEIENKAPSL